MARAKENPEREERIRDEAIVDAYGPEEQALGWYYYLADRISFPFQSRCIRDRCTSPLRIGQEIQVVKMAPEDECCHEMFIEIRWQGRGLAVPLMQIEPIETDDETLEVIQDWHYWVARGYELG